MSNEIDMTVLTGIEQTYGGGFIGHQHPVLYFTKQPQPIAKFAMALSERWGIVACEIDGEDSAGRSKLRRLTPDELAQTACETASALWDQFNARGWMTEVPIPTPKK